MDFDHLAADVGPADLMAVVAKHPIIVRWLLLILIIVCIGYGVFWIIKKNKKPLEKPAE